MSSPVSYTHLDVYKRQVSETLETEEKLPEITEPMLVMRDFTGRRIDTLLLNLRKAKVPKINLKAIVTEQNLSLIHISMVCV